MDKPKFKHANPEQYQFLGHLMGHDLWFYPVPNHPALETVIARFGDEAHEYTSGLHHAQKVLSGEMPVDTSGRRCEWDEGSLALGAALLALRSKRAAQPL